MFWPSIVEDLKIFQIAMTQFFVTLSCTFLRLPTKPTPTPVQETEPKTQADRMLRLDHHYLRSSQKFIHK